MIAKHLIFVGRVQGVGFRFTAYHIANRHKVTGFVRNLPDGTVEMLAQGNSEQVGECIREIQDSFTGYIRDTRMEDVAPDPQYGRFNITF